MINIRLINYLILVILLPSLSFAQTAFNIRPMSFVKHKTAGGIWHINEKGSTTIAGLGISANARLNSWSVSGTFIAMGITGKIHGKLFDFSPEQGLPFLDSSRDGSTHWVEYATTKITYDRPNFTFSFGKFDRHWGPGTRSLIISNKPPAYPQFGFEWELTSKLDFSYFHGFLNSQIPDSSKNVYYNEIGKRSFDVPRSIAAHRLEWTPYPNLILGVNESVVYASRQVDFQYLMPFISLWHMENHLGDVDNAQVGIDVNWRIKPKSKVYFSLYIDEWTPEWTFNKSNHNWFGWQFGFAWTELFMKSDKLEAEFTWTDHRIYRHRFSINDYYSHGYPLGFWAGPHAQELFIKYEKSFHNYGLTFTYSDVTRGELTEEMLENQYEDILYKRFSGSSENRMVIEVLIQRSFIKDQLGVQTGVEFIRWKNPGFDPYHPDLFLGRDIKKWSISVGVYYNIQ